MTREQRTELIDRLIDGQNGDLKKKEYSLACSDAITCIFDLVRKLEDAQRSSDSTTNEALRRMFCE